MPALRVLSVVLLAGLGAAAAGVAGISHDSSSGDVRGALATPLERGDSAEASRGSAPWFDAQVENARPGTPGWRIDDAHGTAPGLAAWASAVSVQAGARVALHIAGSGAQPITVRAFRIGWYDGAGARQVWQRTLPAGPGVSTQTPSKSWPVRGLADTGDWPPGQYLLRLDAGSASRYVPLLVRSPQLSRALVVVTAPLTWEAENGSAGNGSAGNGSAEATTSRSFDQPYRTGYGAGPLLATDGPIIRLAERDGTSIAYTSDLDLALGRSSVAGATGLAFGSASQYWTADLRTDVMSAIKRGTNVAFFGAGTGTRRVKVATSGRSLTIVSAAASSTTALTGLHPACGASASTTSWVVQEPQWWGYARASVTNGEALPGLVGGVPDGLASELTEGEPTVLAQSPVTCGDGRSATQAATYWTSPAGAGVFTAGTSRWVCAAGNTCPRGSSAPVPERSRAVATQVTRDVLQAFAGPKAGLRHPA